MNFWKKVDDELVYQGKMRKELAIQADFDSSYIPKGIARKSVPAADLALKIAHALNVPLEQLLEMELPHGHAEDAGAQRSEERIEEKRLFTKYKTFLTQFDALSEPEKSAVTLLVAHLAQTENTLPPPRTS